MTHSWEREDVSHWAVCRVEQAGSARNLWLEEPETGAEWLHKDTVIPSNGQEQGEDWSEVVSTAVATLLGVPCAPTRLCTRDGRRGSLSRSIRPDTYDLWEGRVVLEDAQVPGYHAHSEGRRGIDPERPEIQRPGHSLENIRIALADVAAPRGFPDLHSLSGYDVFAGYMVLDALIGNRDRHEQNWAVLAPRLLGRSLTLAPSYDHASSLGYNSTDARRQRVLGDPLGLEKFGDRGTAYRFENAGSPPTLVEHAARALALASPEGAHWWRGRLDACDLSGLKDELRSGAIPEMSHPAVMFALAVLDLNLRRLRHATR